MNASCKLLYQEVTSFARPGGQSDAGPGETDRRGGGEFLALIADAVNSLGDVVTTLVVLYAFRVAQLPADAEHPYGHTRAEGITTSNVAVLIIVSALLVGWGGRSSEITTPHDVPPVWTLWIAGANVLIKEALYQYKVRVGRRTGSAAIIANAWDHRSDALSPGGAGRTAGHSHWRRACPHLGRRDRLVRGSPGHYVHWRPPVSRECQRTDGPAGGAVVRGAPAPCRPWRLPASKEWKNCGSASPVWSSSPTSTSRSIRT